MTIFEGSRYENSPVVQVLGLDGAYHAEVKPVVPVPVTTQQTILMPFNGRYDQAAWVIYGDPEQWWRVAAQNPDVFYPDDIAPGTPIAFPSVNAVT